MKFSEQWLRTWVNPEVDRRELVARLSMVGLEVDAVEPVAADFSGVVVGEILTTEPHPDAQKLQICQVSSGNQQFQIVCGAPNARPGIKIPFAMLGAVLPGDFKIKKAKLRGVESFGMLCSAAELGLSEDNDGLYELPENAPLGADLRCYLELDDASIEIGLTPNRGDCLSIAGLAREVGAIYGCAVQPEAAALEVAPVTLQEQPDIEIQQPDACPRYLGRIIRGVDLQRPSPLWITERLRRSGMRSIDPVVDVTNYVMLELGQPLHAFDFDQVKGGIQVRLAHPEEPLVLLDGKEVLLNADTLVIADHQKTLAMAGVVGGEQSGVSVDTRSLLLESAFFESIALAGKARAYGLHTDASHRFERGVDANLARRALERATVLLLDIVGGEAGAIVERVSEEHLPKVTPITLRAERIQQILGVSFSEEEVDQRLSALGFEVSSNGGEAWTVSVPSHRFDVALEIDLIEELGRLYGYDQLPVRYPQAALAPMPREESLLPLATLRQLLVARGYQEAITYSFIDPALSEYFHPGEQPLVLANPISSDMAAMRLSLWPGLVKAVEYNLNRQQSRVRLFETGLRFVGGMDNLRQEVMLAGVITGSRYPLGWTQNAEPVDFYDIKGDVEAILRAAGNADAYVFCETKHAALHPGQCAAIKLAADGTLVGYIGALHPELTGTLGLTQTLYLFELSADIVRVGRLPQFQELSRFPEVSRDIAIVVNQAVPAEHVLQAIRSVSGEYLAELTLFDVYQGKGIDPEHKSLAVGLTWQHPSRTLNDDEINACLQAVLDILEKQFDAKLRK